MGEGKVWREKVSTILHNMFELQYGGATSTKFRWMQGYTDGYIQALIDMGFMPEERMLELIQNERGAYLDTHEAVADADLDRAA
jgi:hypothetical protein